MCNGHQCSDGRDGCLYREAGRDLLPLPAPPNVPLMSPLCPLLNTRAGITLETKQDFKLGGTLFQGQGIVLLKIHWENYCRTISWQFL